jgi:catechol 2,3-dioxygenase-like lactoylglutathione lyase family enzyme
MMHDPNVARPASTREVILQSPRFDEAKAFYGGVLGFKITIDNDRIVGFETGSFALYVERGTLPGPVFEIACDDVAALKADLLRHGCAVIEEDAEVPRCYLRDQFGFAFNLTPR